MATKKIRLAQDATHQAVFDTTRRALENYGYKWQQLDRSNAEAHEGGAKIKSTLFTIRLLVDLRIQDGTLVLKARSSGLGLVGATENPAALVIIGNKLGKCAKIVRSTLHQAGLV